MGRKHNFPWQFDSWLAPWAGRFEGWILALLLYKGDAAADPTGFQELTGPDFDEIPPRGAPGNPRMPP